MAATSVDQGGTRRLAPEPGAPRSGPTPTTPQPRVAEDAPRPFTQQPRLAAPEALAAAFPDPPRNVDAAPTPPQHTPEQGRAAALQLAAAAANLHTGGVEITLSPEELGRVRLSMSGTEGAMTITIQAERGETLDLLRRNIELLAQELRELGFGTLNFSFGQGRQGAEAGAPASEQESGSPAAGGPTPPTRITLTASSEAALDLRL